MGYSELEYTELLVDLEYTELEYTELVLTTEHPLQHLDIPEMNFYARWASLFDRLCLESLFDRLCLL